MIFAILALFAGCNPEDGELIDASFAAYMSEVSPNILPFTQVGEPVPSVFQQVDCRDLATEDEVKRLDGVDYEADCLDGGEPKDPGWFYWLDDNAYYVASGAITPWRVEAVRTIEDDIQVLFHFEQEHIGDSRLGFSIDPDFLPVECVDGDNGAVLETIDGDDWLTHWSEGQTNAAGDPVTLYMLNAYSYQLNPSNTDDYWYFDDKRSAGTAFGRFGSEDILGHGVDYTDYVSSAAGTPLYPGTYGDTYDSQGQIQFDARYADGDTVTFEELSGAILEDLADNGGLSRVGKVSPEVLPMEFILEDNQWRPETEGGVGLSDWVGIASSWVKIDANPDFEPGKSKDKPKFSGEFQLALDGYDAGGFVFAHGSFKIYNLRDDADAGYENLEEIKREENNTPVCPAN